MSQIAVTIVVGGEDDPMVYVCREQTVIVNSDDGQELVLAAAQALDEMVSAVGGEARKQLSTLAQVAGS